MISGPETVHRASVEIEDEVEASDAPGADRPPATEEQVGVKPGRISVN
jgi:hypothetical protein